jgi:hypothetical protein
VHMPGQGRLNEIEKIGLVDGHVHLDDLEDLYFAAYLRDLPSLTILKEK